MKRNVFILIACLFFATGMFSQVTVNTDGSAADLSAGLDVKFTDKGVLLPRMTFDQRNSIASPAEGLMVFCTNCGLSGSGMITVYSKGKWMGIWSCILPVPVPGTHDATPGQITWKWYPVTSAASYKWNTINEYSTATDMGQDTCKTETGLNCSTSYTRFVWAYSICRISAVTILNQSTSGCP